LLGKYYVLEEPTASIFSIKTKDGGSKFSQNVGAHLSNCKASLYRWQKTSQPPLWEP